MSAGQMTRCSIDSSSLIHCRHIYPIDLFPGVWAAFDRLVTNGRLMAHAEVWAEINKGTDPLTLWAGQWQSALCVAHDAAQVAVVSQIANDFPQANYSTTTEHRADPWVVALAQTRSCVVVSEEGGISPHFPRIPQLCAKYAVPHLKIVDVMRAEGWRFA